MHITANTPFLLACLLQQSRVACLHMTPDLNISMWKSVHLAFPQAVGQAASQTGCQLPSVAAHVWFNSWMWIQGVEKKRVGENKPDVGYMQGTAICHSSRALPGLPTGLEVAQYTRTAVTGWLRDMKSQANRLTEDQIQQERSVTSPLEPADFHKSHRVPHSPPDPAAPSS